VLVSSARYKRDIQDMVDRSARLLKLRPVTFRYKHDPSGERQYGLIAEEVARVYPELVTRSPSGELQSVRYEELGPMLLNEVERQRADLTAQAREIAQLAAQNAQLSARLARLEETSPAAATLARR
jgi:hypothetical protein